MIDLDGQEIPWQEGMTVADLMETIVDAHHYVGVRINGCHISRPQYADTPVPDNATVYLIQMIAGG